MKKSYVQIAFESELVETFPDIAIDENTERQPSGFDPEWQELAIYKVRGHKIFLRRHGSCEGLYEVTVDFEGRYDIYSFGDCNRHIAGAVEYVGRKVAEKITSTPRPSRRDRKL